MGGRPAARSRGTQTIADADARVFPGAKRQWLTYRGPEVPVLEGALPGRAPAWVAVSRVPVDAVAWQARGSTHPGFFRTYAVRRAGERARLYRLGGVVRPYVYPAEGVNGGRRLPLSRLGLLFAVLLFLSGAAVFSTVAAANLFLRPAATPQASELTPSEVTPAPASTAVAEPASATAAPVVPAVPPGPDSRLLTELQAVVADTRARVGIAVVDLRGPQPKRTELNAGATFGAASTYKFVALMANAEHIAAGSMRSSDRLCFRSSQAEDGWFKDYTAGECFSRQTLAARAARYSDNTAGHMLVDSLGGGMALNAYARSHGATRSAFYYPNRTTAGDLASLWAAEAQGQGGGPSAQQWVDPLLTRTAFEQGIPAGVPGSARVVHKVGWIDSTVNDAALVTAPGARYVLVVTTDGLGGMPGWALVARISAVVWRYEAH